MAQYYCQGRDQENCLSQKTKELYDHFNVKIAQKANTVFMLLLQHEHPDYQKTGSAWSWVDDIPQSAVRQEKSNMEIVFKSLLEVEKNKTRNSSDLELFSRFINALFKNNYKPEQPSQFMRRIYELKDKDPLTWYYPITSRMSTRLLQLEKQEAEIKQNGEAVRKVMGFGALAVHSYIKNKDHSHMRRSSAPAGSWQRFLPYEIGVDARNGGLQVAWEPSLYLSNKYSLDFNITPVHHNRFAEKEIFFSQVNAFFSYRRKGLVSSLGLGPTFTYTWKEWPAAKQENLGRSVYLGLVQDKLRFTLGERSLNYNDFPGDTAYFMISVTDIPEFFYWLSQ